MLDRESLTNHCLRMTGAYEDFPFGPDAAVYKVKGKMFALIPVDAHPPTISLKCDPIEAAMLRQMYEAIQPGYHLNKKHWNTVTVDSEIPAQRVLEMIEDSYTLVQRKLTKKERAALAAAESSDQD